jgi:hypothetical protein
MRVGNRNEEGQGTRVIGQSIKAVMSTCSGVVLKSVSGFGTECELAALAVECAARRL